MGERNKNKEDVDGIYGTENLSACPPHTQLSHLPLLLYNPNSVGDLVPGFAAQRIIKGSPHPQGLHCLVKGTVQSCNYNATPDGDFRKEKVLLGQAHTQCCNAGVSTHKSLPAVNLPPAMKHGGLCSLYLKLRRWRHTSW